SNPGFPRLPLAKSFRYSCPLRSARRKRRREHLPVKKHKPHDEHMDEFWLIPYADILTLLLALFIVLFASSQIDQKKFDELSQSLNSAFNGGKSFFEPSHIVPMEDSALDKNLDDEQFATSGDADTNEENLTREAREALANFNAETEDLEEIKRQIDTFIEEQGLTSRLETNLDTEQLKINISDS